jgi:hypothetical protein
MSTAGAYNGTGNWNYTNSTGGNVRIIVMSCRTTGTTTVPGTVTCGTATYPIYPNTTWGKGVVNDTSTTPVEYILHDTGIFKIEGTVTGSPTGQLVIDNQNASDLQSTWTVPSNVHNISVVCVGSGAYQGTAGALAWKGNIPVTPGESINYQVGKKSLSSSKDGGASWFKDIMTCYAPGGRNGYTAAQDPFVGDGGGQGVRGAGGYAGDGGAGATTTGASGTPGEGGGGGGNGFDYSYGGGWGGGVGILGKGPSGAAGSGSGGGSVAGTHGQPGSGGSGKVYGGGGGYDGGDSIQQGGQGAIRIIWGDGRAYPEFNTGDDESATGQDTVIQSYNIVVIPE